MSDLNKLTHSEENDYIQLVNSFALAKRSGDYTVSDEIRKKLKLFQSQFSDADFLTMASTGVFKFHSIFESPESRLNRWKRRKHE